MCSSCVDCALLQSVIISRLYMRQLEFSTKKRVQNPVQKLTYNLTGTTKPWAFEPNFQAIHCFGHGGCMWPWIEMLQIPKLFSHTTFMLNNFPFEVALVMISCRQNCVKYCDASDKEGASGFWDNVSVKTEPLGPIVCRSLFWHLRLQMTHLHIIQNGMLLASTRRITLVLCACSFEIILRVILGKPELVVNTRFFELT